MRIDLAAACREALGIWRRDREVIVAIAGIFFFLPALAVALLTDISVAPAQGDVVDQSAQLNALLAQVMANAHWLVLQALAELAGVTTLLALLLDPARPTVGTALRTTVRRLPVLAGAALLVNVAQGIGLLLLILPALYVIGRSFLVLPVLVAEPERRFGDAMAHAIALTKGRVLQLLSLTAVFFLSAQMIVLLLSATASAASSGGGNPVTTAMLATAVAFVGMGMTIALTLVRATVYRRLVKTG